MPTQIRVSLRRLFVWLTAYALLLGTLAGVPTSPLEYVAAIAVLTIFIVADSRFAWSCDSASRFARLWMALAFYATAAAAITAVCFALHLVLPDPPTPPKPALSFLGSVFYLVSGQLVADIGDALSRGIAIRVAYLMTFAVFSAVALSASLFARRHFRSAKWFALANVPGTCLLVAIVAIAIIDVVSGPPA